MPKEVDHKLLIRLPDTTYRALKRFSCDSDRSMTSIIHHFCEQGIPPRFFENRYE